MYRVSVIAVALMVLAVTGCKQPTEVELKPPDEGNVVVTPLSSPPDSIDPGIPISSSALLPPDLEEFAGIILLSSVTYDSAGIRYGAYSWVYFADRTRPFRLSAIGGSSLGFYGLPLASLALNGNAMNRVPHYVQGRYGMFQYQWGWEYRLDLTSRYRPGTIYRWHSGADTVGAIDVSITSPDSLKVLSPVAGTTVSRTSDLTLRWVGQGNLTIILSEVDEHGVSKPVARVHVNRNIGKLVIPSNYLQLLEGRGAWFTFVLANRSDEGSVAGYDANVLVQAASVYNTYVVLH